jgi:hypothetical protein
MNGRVFDPVIGRFMSADIFVDERSPTQGANRYAYVHGRPLSATDPSGWTPISPYLTVLYPNGYQDVSVAVEVTGTRIRENLQALGSFLFRWAMSDFQGRPAAVNTRDEDSPKPETAPEPSRPNDKDKDPEGNCVPGDTGIDLVDDVLDMVRQYGSVDITFNAGSGWGVNAQLSITSQGMYGTVGGGWGVSATAGVNGGNASGWGTTLSYSGGSGTFGGTISGSVSQGGKGVNAGVGWGDVPGRGVRVTG